MIAFDTNVLIYACNKADTPRQNIALDLISRSENAVLLWQVACEFIAASRKLAGDGFTAAEAWQHLAHFLDVFPLVLPTHLVLKHAREIHLKQQSSFWDAMIVAACLESGITRLYSEDLPGCSPEPLEIINPFTPRG